MKRLIPVVLCSIALFAQAGGLIQLPAAGTIDLDKAGALEALQRDNPKHFEAVMKQVDAVQTVQYSDKGVRNLSFFTQPPVQWEGGTDLKLSNPGQARISVPVDAIVYLITVRLLKDPAHLIPAR